MNKENKNVHKYLIHSIKTKYCEPYISFLQDMFSGNIEVLSSRFMIHWKKKNLYKYTF